MRHRGLAVCLVALAVWGVSEGMLAHADWRDPACEVDGGEAAGSAACTPPSDRAQARTSTNSCLGAAYCEMTYRELDAAGFPSEGLRSDDLEAASDIHMSARSGAARRLAYGGWISLYNYRGRRCSGTVRDSGHCAWLYHKYRVFEGGDPKGGIHVTAFPSRSGNNDPSDKWVRNVGPIPNRFRARPGGHSKNDYRWGRMNGSFTGFERDGRESFYPGLWRLDPWVIYKPHSRYYRSSFEVHGGRNSDGSSRLWTTRTAGCIRLSIAGIRGLKSKWDRRTDNRRTARLYVVHNA